MNTNLRLKVGGHDCFVYTGACNFDAKKPTVVFIHGAAMDHSVWVLPCRYFARHGINVLAPDLPGHGLSDGSILTSIEAMADWITHLMDMLDIKTSAVVGHSMGSLVAFDVARRHTSRVRSLALVGSALPMAVSDPLLNSSKMNSHDAIDMLTYWGYSRGAQLGGNETPGMWMVGGTLRLLERAGPGVLHNDLNACNKFCIDTDREPGIEVPSLLILGSRDMMTPPRYSGALSQLLPQSRTVVLDGSGHTLMSEKPDAMLDALITIV